jgi:mevalonate kinase
VEPGASTKRVVDSVRRRRQEETEGTDRILEQIGIVTTRAGSALGAGDVVEAGRLMTRNHELLAELGVSTPGLDDAVETLLSRNALGAKLTGAGGGGAVVALVRPEGLEGLLESIGSTFRAVFAFSL